MKCLSLFSWKKTRKIHFYHQFAQGMVKVQVQNIYFPGKQRRLTLIECNNDINSMIDIAKIADLVSNLDNLPLN